MKDELIQAVSAPVSPIDYRSREPSPSEDDEVMSNKVIQSSFGDSMIVVTSPKLSSIKVDRKKPKLGYFNTAQSSIQT